VAAPTTAATRALRFMRTLWALDHALHCTSKRMAGTLGVTGPQRLVIRLVGRQPAITAGELARSMHVHPSTLTGIVRRLERDGLVSRTVDVVDRRQVRFALTGSGRRIDIRTGGTVEAAVERALARAPAAEADAAARLLATITAALRDQRRAPRRRGAGARAAG
jgi:DNA-binding MarR family transcriptional regulator